MIAESKRSTSGTLIGLALLIVLALATTIYISMQDNGLLDNAPQILEFSKRTEAQKFSKSVKQECLARSNGRDMITGEKLRHGYQFHHIKPVQMGGMGNLDNCLVINRDTHNALHEQMSNGSFSIRQYFPGEVINPLSPGNMRRVTGFLKSEGWLLDDGYWVSPYR